MSKLSSLLAGAGLMTLLIYQSRINLLTNTAHVQGQIDETKESADWLTNKKDAPLVRISLARTPTALERSVDNSIQYYERRLVPSGIAFDISLFRQSSQLY